MKKYCTLTEPSIRVETGARHSRMTLPETLAALAAGQVEAFTALRPHQAPAWHMFLCQLASLACARSGLAAPPADTDAWAAALRCLTPDFPDDEPWRLTVMDPTKPGFLQAPVPAGVELKTEIATPDALDMLITSKNHDIKASVAAQAEADDWIFALVSLQTMEGYGGSGNHGVARMNGGSSSRALLSLAPMAVESAEATSPHVGARFRRDVARMLSERDRIIADRGYGGGPVALCWLEPWPEGAQLTLDRLDLWFIEICRRVRLQRTATGVAARSGTSAATRIDAKAFNGVLGDPWAPVHSSAAKTLTLGEDGAFDYRRIVELLLSGDWEPPLLATLSDAEAEQGAPWVLIAQAIARGNSKSGGFRERIIPIAGDAGLLSRRRTALHSVAQAMIKDVAQADRALREGLALAAADGVSDKIDEKSYARTRAARARLDAEADRSFFPALWRRFVAAAGSAEAEAATKDFQSKLAHAAEALLEEGLADLPCASVFRPRAEARARRRFNGAVRAAFPLLFEKPVHGAATEGKNYAAT